MPLGLRSAAGDHHPVPGSVPLGAGDQMLLYTDGVTEAHDTAGSFYPLCERVHLLGPGDPDAALDAARADVAALTAGPPLDDAAMLLFRFRASLPLDSGGAVPFAAKPGRRAADGEGPVGDAAIR